MDKEWFKLAELDLLSAKLLLENKIYNNAIFHLQQANEKLAKGILDKFDMLGDSTTAITSSFYKEFFGKIKFVLPASIDYSHNWHVKFVNVVELLIRSAIDKKMLPETQNLNVLEELNKNYNLDNKEDIKKIIFKAKYLSQVQNLLKVGSDSILEANITLGDDKYKISIPTQKMDISKLVSGAIDIAKKANPNTKIDAQGVISTLSGNLLGSLFSLCSLALISGILYPQEQASRYPSEYIYNESNILVVEFSQIFEILESILKASKSGPNL
jgi:hypothetical protein